MSMSDSDSSSSHFGDHKTFRQIGRDRLLYEMLRSTKVKDSKSKWKVLIMDKITVKVMSYSCKMADITEEGVSLVEDLDKRRQPLPSMDAIYFMQPTRENVVRFLADMSGRSPLYKKAFVFFSSPVNKDLVALIKRDSSVLPRIGALSETNLEYFAIDSQGFVTDHERALEELFGENAEGSHKYNACLNTMAIRISTVLASLREFPYLRYRAAKSCSDVSTLTTLRDLVPTKLAALIWNCIAKYKSTIPDFPQKETCEFLIVDRSIDQIAPIIHEWTYDAMCHDLLNMEGNKYTHQVPSKMGSTTEKKEVLLEDHDPIWLELRDSHIADASERLHEKMTNFISKNKAAQIHSSRDGGELSTRDLQKMVQALPQYSEQIDKLSLHVEIAGKINKIIREQGLREIGQLEQDLVFGDAGTKELIQFLRTKQDASRESKLRLMMIYASINPEKFEGDRASKLMQLAQLSSDDMIAVNNMRYLGTSDNKKASGSTFSLKFDMSKKKHGIRKERKSEEETWQLSRFYPLIEELIEKLSKGELSKDDYPCLNDPCATVDGTSRVSVRTTHSMPAPAQSVRSRPTPTWARPRSSDDGYSSDSVLRHASSDFKRMGQRMFIFIIGGATRSELRVVHKLTSKLKREIILGSSSLDDPPQFITKLKLMSAQEISLDELQI
ncbi:SNARE-interacting protein KEULE-like [Zingiber officinale]|uniref:SNARE-interacting protein KEULE-like n=2 Tax=Zingiber officinale TaxID=94328 RepID=UPI001C4D7E27|nr:SNARE-interacting protein KEULE-like isoform X1 [Zingiber officinale]XP_042403476.1 SNARE-interacting protein KEULE-like isoform X1 [Zingiber officinale]XP_042403477.1 SNARE-interacting protein KEULE-like isoform X1 [Zingiber officinale]XP_042403478.1 SNARE-interacting protein KEULE-like isoform X1 [Zingiber officinale]XP_042406994.1 SNARE-interacting protein KEULE-like [Zingiber officinale]